MKELTKKEEYLAKIIHDLKTPAIAQACALESLLETVSNKFSKDETDLIKLTLSSCNYMKKLIDTFSSVFKLNSQKLILNYQKFDLAELTSKIVIETEILLKYNNLKVEIVSDKEFIIKADILQLRRVIENLLSNSINNAHKNTTIKISITRLKNQVCFEIRNKGEYIKEKILNEIFEKYKTHSSPFSRTGTGLGLYLSKEIIHAHFGSMIAKSYIEGINVFGFYIPID